MKYNKEIIALILPFLKNSLEVEWELIKKKESKLSSMERYKVQELCEKLEAEAKEKANAKEN